MHDPLALSNDSNGKFSLELFLSEFSHFGMDSLYFGVSNRFI
jgi:hypothetical protein